MGQKFANNAKGVLNAGIASGDLSLTLQAGQGALFPTLGVGDYFYCTLVKKSTNAKEYIKVTARSGDTFTIERAKDGSTAIAFLVGDLVELRLIRQSLLDIWNTPTITGGSIDGTPIGATTPSTGKFTSFEATGALIASGGIMTTARLVDAVGFDMKTRAADGIGVLRFLDSTAAYILGYVSTQNSGNLSFVTGSAAALGTDLSTQFVIEHAASSTRTVQVRGSAAGNPRIRASLGNLDIASIVELTSGGIKFPATQVASADVNTLDDYEEGTWTPSISCATPGDLALGTVVATGSYTKIGNRVMYTFSVAADVTFTSATGGVRITGFPFNFAETTVAPIMFLGFGSIPGGQVGMLSSLSGGAYAFLQFMSPSQTSPTTAYTATINNTTSGQRVVVAGSFTARV